MPSKSKTGPSTAKFRPASRAPSKPAAKKPASKAKQVDLGTLFNGALQFLSARRQDINALDGYNGNHGDNMVANISLIAQALQGQKSKPPSEALLYASQVLQTQGRGSASQFYAKGLQQAADQFQGRRGLTTEDILPLLQTLLSAVPAQGASPQAGGSVLDQLLGLQAQPPPQQQAPPDKLDLGDVLTTLVPAGLTYLQAKQAGADTTTAAGQAVLAALAGGQANPLQTGSPRAAAGGLLVQGLLQALLSKK